MWNEGGEPVGPGMDCLQLRQPNAPFHYLISEQAKSLVALQELQNEVGALLEFRDLVMETFPNLRTKLASSTPTTMTSHHLSNIPVSIRPGDWTPGRVRKKLTSKDDLSRTSKKSGDIAVQDSGFSTETSSKETHSASSTVPPVSASAAGASADDDDVDDELWNLLDLIHRKGTRLKDEVEALQGTLREDHGVLSEENNFQRVLFHASADDVRQLRQERDILLDRMAEMEAEVLAGRVHTSRLQEDLENLLTAKQILEEQLKDVVSQKVEVNSRIHDLHLQFIAKNSNATSSEAGSNIINKSDKTKVIPVDSVNSVRRDSTSSQRTNKKSVLDNVLGDKVDKVRVPDGHKIAAILQEHNSLVLQKHLLKSTIKNQVLQEQLDNASGLEVGLRKKLDKAREENEDLRFQLEDKTIELEGTRARVRLLQKPLVNTSSTSPDIIPALDSTPLDLALSRTEISTASMKAMSPLPINLQMDHSSSTESAHDQAESNRRSSTDGKRKPSKIPLKSYSAPKPPSGGGKHSPAPGARSRSGDSPHRPHSAQSWRNRSEGNSLNNSKTSTPLPKSRNSSLISARDSLSSKLRSSDSLSKLSPPSNSTFAKKLTNSAPVKWTSSSARDTSANSPGTNEKVNSSLAAKRKSQYPWILCLSNTSDNCCDYPDSLDRNEMLSSHTVTENSQKFQTANTFLWNTKSSCKEHEFFDSIDTNLASSLYQQQNGEQLAECDSLERQLNSDVFTTDD